jgi:hypothetical protein
VARGSVIIHRGRQVRKQLRRIDTGCWPGFDLISKKSKGTKNCASHHFDLLFWVFYTDLPNFK